MARILAALATWAFVAGAVVVADGQDALAEGDLGLVVFGVATVALGIAAGWHALWAAALIVPIAALEGDAYDVMLLAVFAVPATAILAAGGAAVGMALGRATRLAWVAGAAALGAAVAAVVVAWVDDRRVVEHDPERPVLVDERRRGAFAGLAVGRPLPPLDRFGRVEQTTLEEGDLAPLGADEGEISAPPSLPGANWELHRARDLVVFVVRGRVDGFLTTDRSAQLSRGVGLGDSLELVEERYDGFDCDDVTLGSDTAEPSYRACSRRDRDDTVLWLGGDPIDSIWVYRDRAPR